MRKYFGTDGIRGKVGEHPVNPEFAMKLGWAAGRVLTRNGRGPVLIGKDTRLSGYMFESALEAGLSASGIDVHLLGPIPTPGIAFLTKNTRAQAGIVISASHNPHYDNGFKFFSGEGYKLDDDIELAIEAELEKPMSLAGSSRLGKAGRIQDAPRRYIEFCKSRLDSRISLNSLHVVIDCANGATYNIAPRVFEELGVKIDVIGDKPDGLNINDGCGATSPGKLRQVVLEKRADLGIALDGDGDRLILVDHTGEVVDGDEALYIIALARPGVLNGAVVGTQMSNLGLEHAIRALDLDFHRASVGDRYIMDMLMSRKLLLGGESSGHIINLNLSTTGDGIISALQILEAMIKTGTSLKDLKSGMVKYPQRLVNVRLNAPIDLSCYPELDSIVREAERELGAAGRILLRPSGTEPLIRVMVEGEDSSRVDLLVHVLADRVKEVLQAQVH